VETRGRRGSASDQESGGQKKSPFVTRDCRWGLSYVQEGKVQLLRGNKNLGIADLTKKDHGLIKTTLSRYRNYYSH